MNITTRLASYRTAVVLFAAGALAVGGTVNAPAGESRAEGGHR